MRGTTPWKVAAGAAAIALFAAGCGGGGADPDDPGQAGGTLNVYGSEPPSLLTTNGNDSASIDILRQVYKGLTDADPTTGAPVLAHAESIESTDNATWTVKLRQGWKFTNGEEVTADNYIDTWNYMAYGPNAQNNSYFISGVEGYDALQLGEDPDGEEGPLEAPDPEAKEMTGLKKIDDYTFTVTLAKAFVGFPAMVGYSGFFAMADACLADIEACKEKPIGNGRYKFEGDWQHNTEIALVRNEDYAGTDKGLADKIVFKLYDDAATAYADFEAGNLDVMDAVPPEKYESAVATYGDNFWETTTDGFTYLGMPIYDENYADPNVRKALSLAIDRQKIIDALYSGRFSPATSWASPNFQGGRNGVCAACTANVDEAKKLMDEAGGWQGGKITFWANEGFGHEDWLKAVGDQWKTAFGIDYEIKTLQWAEYLDLADGHKFTGPFRLGWGPDYAVLETYLGPLYTENASSNSSGYNNPAFDALVEQGNSAATLEEAVTYYQQAEDILAEDFPVLPMWWGKASVVYSDQVGEYVYNKVHGTDHGQIVVAQ